MISENAKLLLATGAWKEAEEVSNRLYQNPFHLVMIRIAAISVLAKLTMRRGDFDIARTLIKEGKALTRVMAEVQRILPVLTAEIELCWMTDTDLPLEEIRSVTETMFPTKDQSWHFANLAYWMRKTGSPLNTDDVEFPEPFNLEGKGEWKAAAEQWSLLGSDYEAALALYDGDEIAQKQALLMLDNLNASAVGDKLRERLRKKGVKNIPRGIRMTTRSNAAQLTLRQIDVLVLLKEGLQNREIAERLFISPKTVDHHISSILSHLDVNSRSKAVVEATKLGILK